MSIINPTPPLVGGNYTNTAEAGLGAGAGYLFQSGNIAPEVSSEMTWLFDNFYACDIFDRIGRNTPIGNKIWSWPEMGYLKQGATVTDVTGTGGSTTSRVLTTNVPVGTPYFIAKMTIMTDYNGIPLNIESVSNAGTYQELTVYLQDQTNDTWLLALGVAGAASGLTIGIGQLATSDAEGETGVASRASYPTFLSNRMNLIKDQYTLTRELAKAKVYTPSGKSYYYELDIQMMKRMKTDRDLAIMFHKWDGATLTGKDTGNGIWQTLNARGTKSIVDGAIQEDDIQDMIIRLSRTSSAREYLVFAGSDAMGDVSRALRPYAIQAMTNSTIFKGDKMAGIPFTQYMFNGTLLTFVHLSMFDNNNALPYIGDYTGTQTSGKINFRSMLMFLNMGSDDTGNKLISLKHLKDSNFLLGSVNGTIDVNGMPVTNGSASTQDAATKFGLMHIAPELRNALAHGLMYRQDA